MTTYCIYPRKPEFHELSALVETLPCGKAYRSKVGTAELHLSGEDAPQLVAAFEWAKQTVPNAATSGMICHAVVARDMQHNGDDLSKVMDLWGCRVTTTVINNRHVMVTGVYDPQTEGAPDAG